MTLDRRLVVDALPNYEIGEEIGRGGWGVVLTGRHRDLGRSVAIKQLPRAFAADPSVRSRFKDEARLIASLDHPHIVPVYDFVEKEGLCLIVMELMPGGTLWDRFTGPGLPVDQACGLMLSASAALHFAHGRGILHRDVKPENFLFSSSGAMKLGDFGIAKLLDTSQSGHTLTGQIIGTPAYMAPEQAAGETIGPYTDVYACAVMLYELLTGELPFVETQEPLGQLMQRLTQPPRPIVNTRPDVPRDIGMTVMRALERDPAARFSTALEFGESLARSATIAFGPGWLIRSGVEVLGAQSLVAVTSTPVVGGGGGAEPIAKKTVRPTMSHVRIDDVLVVEPSGQNPSVPAAEPGLPTQASGQAVPSATPSVSPPGYPPPAPDPYATVAPRSHQTPPPAPPQTPLPPPAPPPTPPPDGFQQSGPPPTPAPQQYQPPGPPPTPGPQPHEYQQPGPPPTPGPQPHEYQQPGPPPTPAPQPQYYQPPAQPSQDQASPPPTTPGVEQSPMALPHLASPDPHAATIGAPRTSEPGHGYEVQPQAQPAAYAGGYAQPSDTIAAAPKKKRGALIVTILLVLALFGAGAFFLVKGRGEGGVATGSTTTQAASNGASTTTTTGGGSIGTGPTITKVTDKGNRTKEVTWNDSGEGGTHYLWAVGENFKTLSATGNDNDRTKTVVLPADGGACFVLTNEAMDNKSEPVCDGGLDPSVVPADLRPS